MARCIKVEDAVKVADYECGEFRGIFGRIKERLEAMPTADVPERKVGKWIFLKADGSVTSTAVHLYPVCSECGFEHPIAKYCPNCGAEMNNWLVLR